MKTLTAQQIFKVMYPNNGKNFITPHVIERRKIDQYTAYELSWGYGFPDKNYNYPKVYGVAVLWYRVDDTGKVIVTRSDSPWSGCFSTIGAAREHIKRLKDQEMYDWQGDYLSLSIWLEDAEYCSQSGDMSNNINDLMTEQYIRGQVCNWDTDKLVKELTSYGAWEPEELQDRAMNERRMLWLICCNVSEESKMNGG